MKLMEIVSFVILLFGFSSHSYSDSTSENKPRFERVLFSEVISGNGTVDSLKRLSIRLINTESELKAAYEYLFSNPKRESYGTKAPDIDLTTGSAVLLDMGIQGNLGHYVLALRATKQDNQYSLTYVTLSPGEGCWAAAQMQRPFQLIYFKEKIGSLETHHIEGFRTCD